MPLDFWSPSKIKRIFVLRSGWCKWGFFREYLNDEEILIGFPRSATKSSPYIWRRKANTPTLEGEASRMQLFVSSHKMREKTYFKTARKNSFTFIFYQFLSFSLTVTSTNASVITALHETALPALVIFSSGDGATETESTQNRNQFSFHDPFCVFAFA